MVVLLPKNCGAAILDEGLGVQVELRRSSGNTAPRQNPEPSRYAVRPQQDLNFLPLPHGQGSFLPAVTGAFLTGAFCIA